MKVKTLGIGSSAAELLMYFRLSAKLTPLIVALTAGTTIAIWVPFYFLAEAFLLEWIGRFWYVPAIIYGIFAVLFVIGFRRRQILWQDLVEGWPVPVGSNAPDIAHTSPHLIGGVRYKGALIGPATTSVDERGIWFSRFGNLIAFIPWSAFSRVTVIAHKNGGRSASLAFADSDVSTLKVLWDDENTAKIPVFLRRQQSAAKVI